METREKATFARYRWADRDIWIKPSFWWGPRYIAPVFPLMKEKKKSLFGPHSRIGLSRYPHPLRPVTGDLTPRQTGKGSADQEKNLK